MSTMKVTTLKNEASSVDNIVLNSDGSVGGELGSTLASKLDANAGQILQVFSTAKTDTFTTTSTSFVDITGLTVSITPSAANSKVLIHCVVNASQDVNAADMYIRLARGGTGIFLGDAAGSRNQITAFVDASTSSWATNLAWTFLDSPSSTSALTYSIQTKVSASTGYVNRSESDPDSATGYRLPSSITVMEVSG